MIAEWIEAFISGGENSPLFDFDVEEGGGNMVYFEVAVEERCHSSDSLGGVSIRKTVLPGMAIPMLKIRRPNGRLIFNMEITIRR